MNIVIVSAIFAVFVKPDVMPVESPVLPSAEIVSKRIWRKEAFSVAVKMSISTTIIIKKNSKIQKAL